MLDRVHTSSCFKKLFKLYFSEYVHYIKQQEHTKKLEISLFLLPQIMFTIKSLNGENLLKANKIFFHKIVKVTVKCLP